MVASPGKDDLPKQAREPNRFRFTQKSPKLIWVEGGSLWGLLGRLADFPRFFNVRSHRVMRSFDGTLTLPLD
jgi:hypothetical protein